jgi:hypothetical protein
MKFLLITLPVPFPMVPVLFAAPHIEACCLNMTVGLAANPDVPPCGGNNQCLYSVDCPLVGYKTIPVGVAEAVAASRSSYARFVSGDIDQAGSGDSTPVDVFLLSCIQTDLEKHMITANADNFTTDDITVIQSLFTNPKHILLNTCVGNSTG